MVIGSLQRIVTLAGNISLRVNGITLQQVETTKCLGFTIDQYNFLPGEIIYKVSGQIWGVALEFLRGLGLLLAWSTS